MGKLRSSRRRALRLAKASGKLEDARAEYGVDMVRYMGVWIPVRWLDHWGIVEELRTVDGYPVRIGGHNEDGK